MEEERTYNYGMVLQLLKSYEIEYIDAYVLYI